MLPGAGVSSSSQESFRESFQDSFREPFRVIATDAPGQPPRTSELEQLYRDFEAELLIPLWTEISNLMPSSPSSPAQAHVWRWDALHRVAARAGDLVPVGRGGERRAIALANPGLGGRPFATPTLWAAIQYLNARESAPVHRHSQNAFRFVVSGSGVSTVVNGDIVPMSRGDFLPQAAWNWHSHINDSDEPMAWIDGLDIPFQRYVDSTFFEPGRNDEISVGATIDLPSRSEQLWGSAGLTPLSQLGPTPATPLLVYRWAATDAALAAQLEAEAEGFAATVSPGHAAVRYTNPTNGADVLPTIRAEFHRLAPGASTLPGREVGSSVFQVFDGEGSITIADTIWSVSTGDLFVLPSWQSVTATASSKGLDLFRFSDSPILESLNLSNGQLWARPAVPNSK
jgi:gentisate 1,2-dioxygenase